MVRPIHLVIVSQPGHRWLSAVDGFQKANCRQRTSKAARQSCPIVGWPGQSGGFYSSVDGSRWHNRLHKIREHGHTRRIHSLLDVFSTAVDQSVVPTKLV